jgi:broad specificity phosphatase PhoE
MAASAGRLVVVRHGPTAWSETGRHTGLTDVELTHDGEQEARALAPRLAAYRPTVVLASPLVRARRTAQLAGLDPEIEPDLREWDYGVYEGRTTEEIGTEIPGWSVWTHEIVGGESLDEVGVRADRVIDRAVGADGDVALVAHAHLLRILTARWIGMPPDHGRHFTLDTASTSVLGWERDTRVICRLNVLRW